MVKNVAEECEKIEREQALKLGFLTSSSLATDRRQDVPAVEKVDSLISALTTKKKGTIDPSNLAIDLILGSRDLYETQETASMIPGLILSSFFDSWSHTFV